MEDVQDLESPEGQTPEESAIITELRSQARAKDKELAKLRTQQAEVETAAQTQRSEAAKSALDTLGFGEGLIPDVLNWVEGDMTRESVMAALEARAIPLPEGVERPKPDQDQAPTASDVGQRVADAAAGVDGRSLDERIASAESQAELNQIMEEADLAREHS